MAQYYTTSEAELTSVANAIRSKGGTSAALEYPSEFVSAINAISTGVESVTVTQTLSSGTEIGSIDVDGTSTTLYAPTPTTYTLPAATTSTLGGVKVDGSTITADANGVISAAGGGGGGSLTDSYNSTTKTLTLGISGGTLTDTYNSTTKTLTLSL